MIEEAICSFEVAKLLKKKEFDKPCWYYYHNLKLEHYFRKVTNKEWSTSGNISAPTHQMAMAWLREKHNMHVDIDPSEGDWYPCVIELETWSSLTSGKMPICNSYEEAVEAGLKYALEELI